MKLISFSLWGEVPMHCGGALENIKLAQEYYPDWTCRFYVDQSVPEAFRDKLRSNGAEVVIVEEDLGPFYGMYWRFFANDDPNVEMFMSRDCDSRLNVREKMAVSEWIASGKALHTMHDHYFHRGVPILGGMWGLRTGVVDNMTGLIHKHGTFDKKGCDQVFLRSHVWTQLRDNVMRHDNGHQMQYGKANRFPPHPPMKFDGTFVGEIFYENNQAHNPVPWEDGRMRHYDGEIIK